MMASIISLAPLFIFSTPSANAFSASEFKSATKSSFLATKSVSQCSAAKTALLPACAGRSVILTRTRPSLTSRPPFFSAISELFFFNIASALFISPPASSRALRHCMMEMPVLSLSFLTCSVVICIGIFFVRFGYRSREKFNGRDAGVICDYRVFYFLYVGVRVDQGHYRDAGFVGFRGGDVFRAGVNHKQRIRNFLQPQKARVISGKLLHFLCHDHALFFGVLLKAACGTFFLIIFKLDYALFYFCK